MYISKIDLTSSIITLIVPHKINFTTRDFQYKRTLPDSSFKVGMRLNKKHLELKCIDISYVAISLYIDDCNIKNELDKNVELTYGFDLNSTTVSVKDKKFIKMFVQGKISRVTPYKSGFKVIVAQMIKKSDESNFLRYIKQRENDTLKEFKTLLKGR